VAMRVDMVVGGASREWAQKAVFLSVVRARELR
jgi:hypothetical protein